MRLCGGECVLIFKRVLRSNDSNCQIAVGSAQQSEIHDIFEILKKYDRFSIDGLMYLHKHFRGIK